MAKGYPLCGIEQYVASTVPQERNVGHDSKHGLDMRVLLTRPLVLIYIRIPRVVLIVHVNLKLRID